MGCYQSTVRRNHSPRVRAKDLSSIKNLNGTIEVLGRMLLTEVTSVWKKHGFMIKQGGDGVHHAHHAKNNRQNNILYVEEIVWTLMPFVSAISVRLELNFQQTFTVMTRVCEKVRQLSVMQTGVGGGSTVDLRRLELIWLRSEAVKVTEGGVADLLPNSMHARMILAWLTVDADCSGTLTLREVTRWVNALNIPMSEREVKEAMSAVDTTGNRELNYKEFSAFFARINSWSELQSYFECFANPGAEFMSFERLEKFFYQFQDAQKISKDEITRVLSKGDVSRIRLNDFGMLMSNVRLNGAMHPSSYTIYHDMSQPLWHYFISSSHNTYLTGDQLTSKSSADMYRNCLRDGCRCVELDCWDGPNNTPIIYHGYTRTSKILFEDAIIAIRNNAFFSSNYPVTLSLEVHTSEAQQIEMADIMLKHFGEMLITRERFIDMIRSESPEHADLSEEEIFTGKYITPFRLKYKIIIKAKRIRKEKGKTEDCDSDKNGSELVLVFTSDDEDDTSHPVTRVSSGSMKSRVLSDSDTMGEGIGNPGESYKMDEEAMEPTQMNIFKKLRYGRSNKQPTVRIKQSKIAKALSDIVFMPSSSLHKDILAPQTDPFKLPFPNEKGPEPMSVVSFGELKSERILRENPAAMAELNKLSFSRIYPAGARITSANYDPMQHWVVGSQLVALNWQTRSSEELRLNLGNFYDNGACGYLLKPLNLRRPGIIYNKYEDSATLSIKVISAFMLPKRTGSRQESGDIISPQIVVKLRGVEADNVNFLSTPTVSRNGYHPVWRYSDSMDSSLPKVKLPEVSKQVARSNKKKRRTSIASNGNPGGTTWGGTQSIYEGQTEGFYNVQSVQMCLMVVQVHDKDELGGSEIIAEGIVPLRAMRQGLRAISLTDSFGVRVSNAVVLMDISLSDVSEVYHSQ